MLTRVAAFAAGATSVFAFAPFHMPPVTLAALGLLFWLWQRAATARDGAWLGFAFGCGMFGAGTSWVYIALATFGGMPLPVALISTAGFVAYLALWPALAGWAVVRLTGGNSPSRLVAAVGELLAWRPSEAADGVRARD